MKKALVFLALLALVTAFAVAVQDEADMEVARLLGLEEGLVAAIMTVFGLGILGITQLVKGFYQDKIATWSPIARHAVNYVVTAVLSAGVTSFVLIKADMFSLWPNLVLYGIWTWGVANGIWKSLKANRG